MSYMDDANAGFLPPSQWHLSPGLAGLRAAGAQMGFGGVPLGAKARLTPSVTSLDALPQSVRAQMGLGPVRKAPVASPEPMPPPEPVAAPKPAKPAKASKAPKASKETAFRAQDFMTKAQFRKLRERAGFPLNADQHVCHIIAESNGGANHIDNFYVAAGSLNQSLGNKNDAYLAEAAGMEQARKAVAVSRTTGYTGPGADELIAMAKAARI